MRPFAARGGAFARASKRGARSDAPKAPAPRKSAAPGDSSRSKATAKKAPKGQPDGARRPWRPGRPRRFDPSHPFIPIHYIEDIWLLSEPGAEIRNNVAYPRRNRPIGAIFGARRTAGPTPGSPSSQRSRWAPKTSRSKSNANGRILGKRRANARKSPTEKGRRRDGLGSKAPRKKRKRNGNKKGVKESGSRGQANKKSRLNVRGDPTLDPAQQTGPMRNALRIRALRKKKPRRSRGRARFPPQRAELTSFRTAPTANP